MPRQMSSPPPTEDEIMSQRNVPPYMAARYIGWGAATLYRALQEGRAPFGFAVQCEDHWAYNISPGLLVKYRRGDLPTYRLKEVEELACEGLERLLDAKMGALKRITEAVL